MSAGVSSWYRARMPPVGDDGDGGAGNGEPSSWRREPARTTRWRGYARSIFSSSVARRASSEQTTKCVRSVFSWVVGGYDRAHVCK
jgi:hypothetical protein